MLNKKKCMKCGQPASHKFTRVEKGQIYDIFLCSDHAAEMSPYQKPKIPLSDIMEGLLKQEGKMKSGGPEPPATLRCPNCGLTFTAYRKNLLLGCSECYGIFREYLIPDLRRFHGNTRHFGRRPGGELNQPGERDFALVDLEAESAGIVPKQLPPAQSVEQVIADPETQLEDLTRVMHRAIAEEDYQRAANCRDQIRELKAKIKKTASG